MLTNTERKKTIALEKLEDEFALLIKPVIEKYFKFENTNTTIVGPSTYELTCTHILDIISGQINSAVSSQNRNQFKKNILQKAGKLAGYTYDGSNILFVPNSRLNRDQLEKEYYLELVRLVLTNKQYSHNYYFGTRLSDAIQSYIQLYCPNITFRTRASFSSVGTDFITNQFLN